MNQLAALHDIAMEFVDEAFFAQKRGDETTAQLFYQKAYNLERTYALSIPKEESHQLSRSVFLRSAATLALDCQKPSEANELAQMALQDNPHPAIVPELQEVLAKAEQATITTGRMDSPLPTSNEKPKEGLVVEDSESELDSELEGSTVSISSPKIRRIQLTVGDEKEADLLIALLGKFDSVGVRYL